MEKPESGSGGFKSLPKQRIRRIRRVIFGTFGTNILIAFCSLGALI
jgi:hypothetical protein